MFNISLTFKTINAILYRIYIYIYLFRSVTTFQTQMFFVEFPPQFGILFQLLIHERDSTDQHNFVKKKKLNFLNLNKNIKIFIESL